MDQGGYGSEDFHRFHYNAGSVEDPHWIPTHGGPYLAWTGYPSQSQSAYSPQTAGTSYNATRPYMYTHPSSGHVDRHMNDSVGFDSASADVWTDTPSSRAEPEAEQTQQESSVNVSLNAKQRRRHQNLVAQKAFQQRKKDKMEHLERKNRSLKTQLTASNARITYLESLCTSHGIPFVPADWTLGSANVQPEDPGEEL